MQVVKENGIEMILDQKPGNFWQRNKKPTLDFLHDTPFAAERQLEDQRLLAEKNRNPRKDEPTKVDKLRSHTIIAKKGQSRAVAIKANVVNKVVREASGIHNYTIIPPPRLEDDRQLFRKEPLEPETNPSVRAYAQESKLKPVMCSFGHRPRSASRTFHPATMRFRLKHGQILPSVTGGRTGVGLPVVVLKQVLHAPKIAHNLAETMEDINHEEELGSSSKVAAAKTIDYSDLFLSKEQQADLFEPNYNTNYQQSKRRQHSKTKLEPLDHLGPQQSKASWVSTEPSKVKKIKESKPEWNEGFHRISLPASHKFDIKASLLNPKTDVPLHDLLHRFSSLSVAENQVNIFCSDKQAQDMAERRGQPLPVPKSTPLKGHELFYDPWDVQVQQVKMLRAEEERRKAEKIAAWEYQQVLKTIPKVEYYPTTRLKEMEEKGKVLNPNDEDYVSDTKVKLLEEYPGWQETENELKATLQRAKRGDRQIMFEKHLRSHLAATNMRKSNSTGGMSLSPAVAISGDVVEVSDLADSTREDNTSDT